MSILLTYFLFMITYGKEFEFKTLFTASQTYFLSTLTKEEQSNSITHSSTENGDISPANSSEHTTCLVSQSFPTNILQWCPLISEYSLKRGLPPDLIAAVILQESGGNDQAYSSSGAVGLMQVMPRDGLAANFRCPAGPCFHDRPSMDELNDPEFNVKYGTKMLADLTQRFGNYRDALKAYGPMDVGYYYADLVLSHYQRMGNQG
jgi:hypothetical protein